MSGSGSPGSIDQGRARPPEFPPPRGSRERADDRRHRFPTRPGRPRHARGHGHRVRDVPLCRRPRRDDVAGRMPRPPRRRNCAGRSASTSRSSSSTANSSARVAQGDLGISYRNQRPVAELIAERLPATLELVLVATAALAGARHSARRASARCSRTAIAARLIQTLSLVGISTPTFVTGIVLILVFAVIAAAGCPPSGAARRSRSAGGRRAS